MFVPYEDKAKCAEVRSVM